MTISIGADDGNSETTLVRCRAIARPPYCAGAGAGAAGEAAGGDVAAGDVAGAGDAAGEPAAGEAGGDAVGEAGAVAAGGVAAGLASAAVGVGGVMGAAAGVAAFGSTGTSAIRLNAVVIRASGCPVGVSRPCSLTTIACVSVSSSDLRLRTISSGWSRSMLRMIDSVCTKLPRISTL